MNFLDICRRNNVAMVLTGHTHVDEIWDRDGQMQMGNTIGSPSFPLYVQTKSVTHENLHGEHGYRLIRISQGAVSDYTYDRDGNGYRDGESSVSAGVLTHSFSPANDGTNKKVTSTIVNSLHEEFQDARLVFKMPKPDNGLRYYAIDGGIAQIIEQDTCDIYYVKTSIPKDSTKQVVLRQGYSFDLEEGWNLVSLPLVRSETDLESVLSSIHDNYDSVQWFDSNDPYDPWKHHNSCKVFGNDLSGIDDKMGLWVHITNPGGATLICYGETNSANPTISLKNGWNLVGYPSLSCSLRTAGLNNQEYGVNINRIQWFDSVTESWYDMGPDDLFVPGRGYWIHSKSDCQWEVPQ
jgi:hypothetical protein